MGGQTAPLPPKNWWDLDPSTWGAAKDGQALSYEDLKAQAANVQGRNVDDYARMQYQNAFGAGATPGEAQGLLWVDCNGETASCAYGETVPVLDRTTGKSQDAGSATATVSINEAPFLNSAKPIYLLGIQKRAGEDAEKRAALVDLYAFLIGKTGNDANIFPTFASDSGHRSRVNVLRQSTLNAWKSAAESTSVLPTEANAAKVDAKSRDFLFRTDASTKQLTTYFFPHQLLSGGSLTAISTRH
jgi:hypothetical protein